MTEATPASLAACRRADAADPLAYCRDRFQLPQDTVYLDGNSLGALPRAVPGAVGRGIERAWGHDLIRSWNLHDWIDLPRRCGDLLAPVLGAAPGTVMACDSISINLFKLLNAALQLRPGRRRILATSDQFPSDLYIASGVADWLGPDRAELVRAEPDRLTGEIDDGTAVVLLSQVDFRSGALVDLPALTHLAHSRGALVLWDLAHSAGVLPLQLERDGVDLAVGCTYKYLNAGPGAPAWLYVAPAHARAVQPLQGWMGHAAPFDFDPDYRPAAGMERWLTGTPAVLAFLALEAALGVWADVDMQQVRAKSMRLGALFADQVRTRPALATLQLRSPPDPARRGSQLAYAHPEAGALCQALMDAGVIGDFRAPDLLRFGFAPLYLRYEDIWHAVDTLERILTEGSHRQQRFMTRPRVT